MIEKNLENKKVKKEDLIELVKSGKIKRKDGSKVNLLDPELRSLLNKKDNTCDECGKDKCVDCKKCNNENCDSKECDCDGKIYNKKTDEEDKLLESIKLLTKTVEISIKEKESEKEYNDKEDSVLIDILNNNNKILSEINKNLSEKNKLEKEEKLKEKNEKKIKEEWVFDIKRDNDGYIERVFAKEK